MHSISFVENPIPTIVRGHYEIDVPGSACPECNAGGIIRYGEWSAIAWTFNEETEWLVFQADSKLNFKNKEFYEIVTVPSAVLQAKIEDIYGQIDAELAQCPSPSARHRCLRISKFTPEVLSPLRDFGSGN